MRNAYVLITLLVLSWSRSLSLANDAPGVPPEQAIKMLQDGNARFSTGSVQRPHQDQARLCETYGGGQHPFAAVLSCADSRVPVELIFDVGIGDLFAVRVAGNVADVDEIGTLEYGVEHLGINTILVLGHGKCGAVTAVVDGAHVSPNIAKLVDNIAPAAAAARTQFPQLSGPRLLDKAIRANVQCAISDLQTNSEIIRERVKSGKLKIVGGVYDLHGGAVDWLDADATATVSAPAAHNQPDGHAAPAHGHEGDAHGAPAEGKPAPSADAHGNAHGDATPSGSAKHLPTDQPVRRDNFVLLGGMMAGASLASWGVIHYWRGGGATATATTSDLVAAPTSPPSR